MSPPLTTAAYHSFYETQNKELEAVEETRQKVEALNAIIGDDDDEEKHRDDLR
jgi:hypothetical protein